MKFSFNNVVDLADLNGVEYKCAHEPNNEVFQYFIKDNRVYNFVHVPELGNYSSTEYLSTTNHVPVQDFSAFGVKNFPNMGAYGWFRRKYENLTHVLIPLRASQTRFAPPSFTFTQSADFVHISIVPPESVEYLCYRVIFRSGPLATEFITYDTEAALPKPASGTYELYVIGYRNTGEISEETPRQAITVVNPTPPPAAGPVYSVNSELPDIVGNIYLPANKIPVVAEGIDSENVRDALVEVNNNTLTITLLASGWSGYTQTVVAPGVTTTNTVIVAPSPAHQGLYVSSAILCTAQGDGTLTFNCHTEPISDIDVGVVIL